MNDKFFVNYVILFFIKYKKKVFRNKNNIKLN